MYIKDTAGRRSADMVTSHVQLAPSIANQVDALISILRRYQWSQFGLLTSEIAGRDDFIQAVRDAIAMSDNSDQLIVQDVFKTSESSEWDLSDLADSEVRIILLYCTQIEASMIMRKAASLGLTGANYMWLVTQSVIGNPYDKSTNRRYLPAGSATCFLTLLSI